MKRHLVPFSILLVSALALPGTSLASDDTTTILSRSARSGLERLAADEGGGDRGPGYREGQRAIDEGRWSEASAIFDRLASAGGADADAALYWQAYALAKDGRKGEALSTLRTLRTDHADSDWLDDAQALELELRGPRGATTSGSADENEELKLYALNGLMNADPEQAVPVLRKFLEGDASPRLKKQALFVLGQTEAPEARKLLESVATGRANAELQTEAIHMLGIAGDDTSVASLNRIYRDSRDVEVRRAVLEAYLIADATDDVVAIARGDEDPDMRKRAIQQLGAMDATAALRELYSREKALDARRTILEAMGVAGDVEALARAAASETDATLRRRAIQGLGIADSPAASEALTSLYASNPDAVTRSAVIEALFIQDNAQALIALFRNEKDANRRREIVQKLSLMDTPESTALLLEMLDQ